MLAACLRDKHFAKGAMSQFFLQFIPLANDAVLHGKAATKLACLCLEGLAMGAMVSWTPTSF